MHAGLGTPTRSSCSILRDGDRLQPERFALLREATGAFRDCFRKTSRHPLERREFPHLTPSGCSADVQQSGVMVRQPVPRQTKQWRTHEARTMRLVHAVLAEFATRQNQSVATRALAEASWPSRRQERVARDTSVVRSQGRFGTTEGLLPRQAVETPIAAALAAGRRKCGEAGVCTAIATFQPI